MGYYSCFLDQLKESGSQLRTEQENLSEKSASLAAEEKSYRRQLAHMHRDLAKLQSRLRRAKLKTASARAQRVELEKSLKTLKVQIGSQEK